MTSFGLQIPNFRHAGGTDATMFDDVCAHAVAAEASGFDSVWVMDHFWQLPALGGPDEPILEAYTLLGALAARTERVQLGTLVTGVTYRNPALLAKIVTTLDVISKGRAVLGIGAAWYEPEHDGLGFDFPGTGERMDRLEEAVQICRALFREEHPTFDGRYYRIEQAANVPRPLQPGRPTDHDRWQRRDAARCASSRSTPTCATSPAARTRWPTSSRSCAGTAPTSAATPPKITTTRMGTLVLTPDADETARVRSFLSGLMGDDFDEQFIVGEPADVVPEVERLVAAGIDCLIFNMPLSDADAVQRAGELLVANFA